MNQYALAIEPDHFSAVKELVEELYPLGIDFTLVSNVLTVSTPETLNSFSDKVKDILEKANIRTFVFISSNLDDFHSFGTLGISKRF